jgi:hypothetical protein
MQINIHDTSDAARILWARAAVSCNESLSKEGAELAIILKNKLKFTVTAKDIFDTLYNFPRDVYGQFDVIIADILPTLFESLLEDIDLMVDYFQVFELKLM